MKKAELAKKSADSDTKLAMVNAAASEASSGIASAKAQILNGKEKLKKVKEDITSGRAKLSVTKDKLDKAGAAAKNLDLSIKEIVAWRQRTKDTATVTLNSAKFQEKQSIGMERKVKSTLGDKMKAIVKAKEKHLKMVVKLKEEQDRVRQLNNKQKEQVDEKKVKIDLIAKEKREKSERNAADKLKRAKLAAVMAAKMKAAAKLQAAAAVTMNQKVKAANALSHADMLKAASDNKVMRRGPAAQKAKVAEEKADDRLKAKKSLQESADKKLAKSKAATKAAKKKLAKVEANGPASIAKKDGKITLSLHKETAKLEGLRTENAALRTTIAKEKTKKTNAALKVAQEIKAKIAKKHSFVTFGTTLGISVADWSKHSKAVSSDMAKKLKVDAGSLKVTGVKAGSTVVDWLLTGSASAAAAVNKIAKEAGAGKLKLGGVSVAAMTPAVVHQKHHKMTPHEHEAHAKEHLNKKTAHERSIKKKIKVLKSGVMFMPMRRHRRASPSSTRRLSRLPRSSTMRI